MSAENYEDIGANSLDYVEHSDDTSQISTDVSESSSELEKVADEADWHISWSKIKLHKELGEGAYGVVYKAEYAGLPIAAKKLKGSIAPDAVKEEFEHEVATLKKLRHPNIILFMGITSDPDDNCYILSEFGDNGSLNTYLHQNASTLTWTNKTGYVAEICLALAYLHENGCLHRDLKAENVLLNRVGVCKVADFGLARTFVGRSLPPRAMLANTTGVGSLWWRAPEVDDPTAEYSGKIDIFSLGITIAEIITSGKSGDDLRLEGTLQDPCNKLKWVYHSEMLVPLLSQYSPPRALIEMVVRCGRLDPAERPSIQELVAVCKKLLHHVRHIEERLSKISAPDLACFGFKLVAPHLSWDGLDSIVILKSSVYEAISERLFQLTSVRLTQEALDFLDTDGPVKGPSFTEDGLIAFLAWYHPLEELILQKLILPLFRSNLIAAFINKSAAESKLATSRVGTIITRLSSRAGHLAITYRKSCSEISHALVKVTPDGIACGSSLYPTFEAMLLDRPQYKYVYPAECLSKWNEIHQQIQAQLGAEQNHRSGLYETDYSATNTSEFLAAASNLTLK